MYIRLLCRVHLLTHTEMPNVSIVLSAVIVSQFVCPTSKTHHRSPLLQCSFECNIILYEKWNTKCVHLTICIHKTHCRNLLCEFVQKWLWCLLVWECVFEMRWLLYCHCCSRILSCSMHAFCICAFVYMICVYAAQIPLDHSFGISIQKLNTWTQFIHTVIHIYRHYFISSGRALAPTCAHM